VIEIGVVFLLLDDLDLLGVILWVGVVVQTSVSRFSEPIVASFELIGVVSIVIFFGRFVDKLLSIGALGSQGEIGSSVLVCRFHILVLTFVSWELGRVGAKFGSGSFAVKEVFRVGPFNFVAVLPSEAVLIDGVDIKVISFQLVVFFIVVDLVRDELFVVVAALVD